MLLTIVAFLFVLSVVIIIHELGHFLVAKMNGIYVITFSIGFGPKLLKLRVGETEYAISALPFGGYVKFAGENETDDSGDGKANENVSEADIPEERYYRNKKPLQRMSVVIAGPLMNALLALALYILSIWIQGIFVRDSDNVISSVVDGSPAREAGLERGDVILEINGRELERGSLISDMVTYEENVSATFKVLRNGDTLGVSMTPRWNEEAGRLVLGIHSASPARIGDVKKDSPAYKAGIRSGARIEAINDTTVYTYLEVAEKIYARNGIPMKFTWEQDGKIQSAVITPVSMDAPSEGRETGRGEGRGDRDRRILREGRSIVRKGRCLRIAGLLQPFRVHNGFSRKARNGESHGKGGRGADQGRRHGRRHGQMGVQLPDQFPCILLDESRDLQPAADTSVRWRAFRDFSL